MQTTTVTTHNHPLLRFCNVTVTLLTLTLTLLTPQLALSTPGYRAADLRNLACQALVQATHRVCTHRVCTHWVCMFRYFCVNVRMCV